MYPATSELNTTGERVLLMGCPVDNLSLRETIRRVERMIHNRKPHQHVVINVDKLLKLRKDRWLKEIISSCDIINADGMPIVWASKILGIPLKERITGTDLMEHLVRRSSRKGYRLYFLGAREEVVRKVVEKYRSRFPSLQVAGFRNGYWRQDEEDGVVHAIKETRPDILFVGFSSPKKELFIHKHLQKLNVPFTMGVGGSFDVVAGVTRRAPRLMQGLGLEWLFRLLQEPKRLWKRYLIGNTVFIGILIRTFIDQRLLGRDSPHD